MQLAVGSRHGGYSGIVSNTNGYVKSCNEFKLKIHIAPNTAYTTPPHPYACTYIYVEDKLNEVSRKLLIIQAYDTSLLSVKHSLCIAI